ncbi:hypothetical protein PMIT1303_02100 [Prochlorococcus sp. MIT 1303]|nr:hypothetical protein PMIT1306_01971 [Prochlorococcus sp. MIT 1306]KZR61898.1 hypothetical protein PMIT1303_02100 [Prochlorococcus sp. MIT 1303]
MRTKPPSSLETTTIYSLYVFSLLKRKILERIVEKYKPQRQNNEASCSQQARPKSLSDTGSEPHQSHPLKDAQHHPNRRH